MALIFWHGCWGLWENWGGMMTQVATLRLSEEAVVDQDELTRIFIKMEYSKAEEIISSAIDELSRSLTHAERLNQNAETAKLLVVVQAIADLAALLGMAGLAQVSRDVAKCCDQNNRVAVSATVARLLRVGKGSLKEIWELTELPV